MSSFRLRPRLATVALLTAGAALAIGVPVATAAVRPSVARIVVPKAPKDPKLAAEVPGKIRHSGALTVALDATYAPDEFIATNGHTIIGMDADLIVAIGQVLGLKVNPVNATFATIIPGLQSGKFNVGISSMTDRRSREKVVDFVDYFKAGESFYVPSSSSLKLNGLASLCGHKVSVENGTTEQSDAALANSKCKAAHKPGVSVDSFTDQNGANLAVASGRDQLGFADSQVAAYIVKQSNGVFKLDGKAFEVAPYGIALPKGNGMAKPVLGALKELIHDSIYRQILNKWGTHPGAISNPTIDGAVS
jgi:polar amino acid transport system substrate-binding protein